MKLKFIKESIIINEKSSDVNNQPSEKALKGFRLNVLSYIKKEFVDAVKKKGLLCVLDEKSKPITLNIQYPKNMDILEPETVEITDEIIENGLDIEGIIDSVKTAAENQLKTTLDKIKLSEAIINEGPIANLFAKMAAKKQIKKEVKAENDKIKTAVDELNKNGLQEISLENNKIIRISIIAKYNKTDIEISCKLYEDLPIITMQLEEIESGRGYYISDVKDCFGNKLDGLRSDLPIEDALQRIAEKIGVQIPEPKFNTVTGRPDENTLQKRIKNDDILTRLYNNDYINNNTSREIAKLLSNVKENLNDPKDFATYKKALSMANNSGKYSPYTGGLIIQYMIKKEFSKCAEKLRDTNELRKFLKFIEAHLELDDIKDKLIELKEDGDLKKFFGHKLEIAPIENCEITADEIYYEKGDIIKLIIVPEEGFVFEEVPTIEGVKAISIDKGEKENSFIIEFKVDKVFDAPLKILGNLVEKKADEKDEEETKIEGEENSTKSIDKEVGDVKDETSKKEKNTKKTPKKASPVMKNKKPVEKDYNKMLKDLKNLGLRIDTTKLFTYDADNNITGITDKFKQLKKVLKG